MDSTEYKDALRILKILEESGYQARLVGGCVRDRLLGLIPKDYDVATDAIPEDVVKIFKKQGVKVIPTGIDHGTVTIIMNHSQVEVTTLRIDIENDGRHAKVEFSNSFQLDAKRRDFTINAMSEDSKGNVYDYFSGKKDLKQNKIQFVGDPAERIQEDFLRILRFFRFLARFKLSCDQETCDVIAHYAENLTSISQERVTSELKGILSCKEVTSVLELMNKTQVLKIIVPELYQNESGFSCHSIFDMIVFPSFLNRLALVFLMTLKDGWQNESAKKFCRRLKLFNREEKTFVFLTCQIKNLLAVGEKNADVFRFLDDVESSCGDKGFHEYVSPVWSSFFLHQYDEEKRRVYLDKLKTMNNINLQHGHLRKEKLPLSGKDLISITELKGKEFGLLMHMLKDGFYNQEWQTKEEGKEFILSIIKKNF